MINVSEKLQDRCRRAACRSCGKAGLQPILDLGRMPLSDGLLTEAQLNQPESKYPLEWAFCDGCALVQILESVPPRKLFCEDYPYYSSFSDDLLRHSRDNVQELIDRRRLDSGSFVVEIASNDGYLLKNYVEQEIPCLGIDPAEGPVKMAEKVKVPSVCSFFTRDLARQLVSEGKQADIIHANNVLAHVPEQNAFVEGLGILLKDNGLIVIEVPYVRDLVDYGQFDTIYHEHLCYFSLTALDNLFRRHDLFLVDVKRLTIHGGSLRLYIEKQDKVRSSVHKLLAEEQKLGIDRYDYYKDFGQRVQKVANEVSQLLLELKQQGKRIVGYGAAAKGAILLNFLGIGREVLEYVVDRNIHKQGKFMPGVHIPIRRPEQIAEDMPDYVLILPWNFKDEIIGQQNRYRERGGKFIIPIPAPEIV